MANMVATWWRQHGVNKVPVVTPRCEHDSDSGQQCDIIVPTWRRGVAAAIMVLTCGCQRGVDMIMESSMFEYGLSVVQPGVDNNDGVEIMSAWRRQCQQDVDSVSTWGQKFVHMNQDDANMATTWC
jgi:hypothetical protein